MRENGGGGERRGRGDSARRRGEVGGGAASSCGADASKTRMEMERGGRTRMAARRCPLPRKFRFSEPPSRSEICGRWPRAGRGGAGVRQPRAAGVRRKETQPYRRRPPALRVIIGPARAHVSQVLQLRVGLHKHEVVQHRGGQRGGGDTRGGRGRGGGGHQAGGGGGAGQEERNARHDGGGARRHGAGRVVQGSAEQRLVVNAARCECPWGAARCAASVDGDDQYIQE